MEMEKQLIKDAEGLKEVALYFHKDLEAVNKDEPKLIPYAGKLCVYSLFQPACCWSLWLVLCGCICWVKWGTLLDDAGSSHVWADPLVVCHIVVFFALEVWVAEVSNFVISLRK